MNQNQSNASCTDINGTLPFELGFHFCLDGGNYTGITATNMHEFTEELRTIDQNSIEFHMKRQDFQKWIKNEFCDSELPKKIDCIRNENVHNEVLRRELLDTVNAYLKKWKNR